jgi:hypothetical protein
MPSCNVDKCQRPAVVKEIYRHPEGGCPIVDEVCSYHTGRNPKLHMIGRDPVIGEVEYKIGTE